MDCRGMQSTRLQAEKFPSCHHSGQGAENREVPGRGPPQEDSRPVSPVRARGGAANGRTGAWVGGCPWAAAKHAARAPEREGQESVDERVEGSWANRGRRQEEVSIGSACTSYLAVCPAVLWRVEEGRQGAGWEDKVWGSLFAGRQGQWLGSPFEEAQAGSSETC